MVCVCGLRAVFAACCCLKYNLCRRQFGRECVDSFPFVETMAGRIAYEETENGEIFWTEVFDATDASSGMNNEMDEETEEELPEDWTKLGELGCEDKVAAVTASAHDGGQAGGGSSTSEGSMNYNGVQAAAHPPGSWYSVSSEEGVSAAPGIYVDQSSSVMSPEIAGDWVMTAEGPVGAMAVAPEGSRGEAPGRDETSEAALRFRRCWAEPTAEAWEFLLACLETMNAEEGLRSTTAHQSG